MPNNEISEFTKIREVGKLKLRNNLNYPKLPMGRWIAPCVTTSVNLSLLGEEDKIACQKDECDQGKNKFAARLLISE